MQFYELEQTSTTLQSNKFRPNHFDLHRSTGTKNKSNPRLATEESVWKFKLT